MCHCDNSWLQEEEEEDVLALQAAAANTFLRFTFCCTKASFVKKVKQEKMVGGKRPDSSSIHKTDATENLTKKNNFHLDVSLFLHKLIQNQFIWDSKFKLNSVHRSPV